MGVDRSAPETARTPLIGPGNADREAQAYAAFGWWLPPISGGSPEDDPAEQIYNLDLAIAEIKELQAKAARLQANLDAIRDHYCDHCFCVCHFPHIGGGAIVHFFPCCYDCPGCGHRIEMAAHKRHAAKCPGVLAIKRAEAAEAEVARLKEDAKAKFYYDEI